MWLAALCGLAAVIYVTERLFRPWLLPRAITPAEEVVVPQDIRSQAAQWADEHARAAHLARAVELFHEFHDWDQVRLAMREDTQ